MSERLDEIRDLVEREKAGQSVSDLYSAARLLDATVYLLALVERYREAVEDAENFVVNGRIRDRDGFMTEEAIEMRDRLRTAPSTTERTMADAPSEDRPDPRRLFDISDEELEEAFLYDHPLLDYTKRELAAALVFYGKEDSR